MQPAQLERLAERGTRRARLACTIAALALLASALAQAEGPEVAPFDLARAQQLAVEASVDVAARRADLEAAQRDQARAERDPLATRLERLQAGHAVAAAAEAASAAVVAARVAALQRFTAVLEAEDALAAAAGAAEVAERQAAAERVRADAGLITAIDLARAEQDAASAARAHADARISLDLARSELALALGVPVATLEASGLAHLHDDLPPLPPLEQVLDLDPASHAGLAGAERALAVAGVRLAGGDHEGTAPNVLAMLRSDVSAAERRLADTRATAVHGLRSSYQAAQSAYARYHDALASQETAQTTFAAQRVRADAGELSALALRQASLDLARAEANVRAALHAAWSAWYRLEQARAGS